MTTQAQARAALLKAAYLAYGDTDYRQTMDTLSAFINENPSPPTHRYTRSDVENITNKLRGNKKWAEYVRRYRRDQGKGRVISDQEWSALADGYMAGMVDATPSSEEMVDLVFKVYYNTPFTVTVS